MANSSGQDHDFAAQDMEINSSVLGAKILIVDDMNLMQQMIGACLKKGGFQNLSYASDGDEALELIKQDMPDIVVLDLNMPRVSGYEVCRTLRANPLYDSLAILVQSASESPEERVEVFNSGATDFVSKPINQPELLARVRMHLENKFLIHSLKDFRATMQNELKMAREMQWSLLPEEAYLKTVQGTTRTKIESFYQASFELGGDLWGCWLLPDNRIGLYVLDITGHGVGAALNTFRVHATMARFKHLMSDPARFLKGMNDDLNSNFALGQFATMFYGVMNYLTGDLTYAGAGAPRPIIVNDSGEVRLLDSSGIPVGAIKSAEYENLTDKIAPDESILCYSDALIEAPRKEGGIVGEEGLVSWVEELTKEHGRHKMMSEVLRRFFKQQTASLPDDLTSVALHR